MKNIILFGAPGSGKGTQSEKIEEKYELLHVSTGDLIRKEIKAGTPLGIKAKGFIDKGELIPDEDIVGILAELYDTFTNSIHGVVLDGFPRTIPQAEALKEMLDARNERVSTVIELEVPEDELFNRILNRAKSSGRSDDNDATIHQRLKVYHDRTEPVSSWYKKEGVLHLIDGMRPMEDVFKDICEIIDNE